MSHSIRLLHASQRRRLLCIRPVGPLRSQRRPRIQPHRGQELLFRLANIKQFRSNVAQDRLRKRNTPSPPESYDPESLRARVEAVLFISREPLPARKITALSSCADSRQTRKIINELNDIYVQSQRSFQIKRLAGGYQMLTRPQFSTWLRRLEHLPRPRRLSTPAMETLAVVAYRQPIMKAEIEIIRGVNCGEMLKQLIERGLVRISGRSDELGRPYLYSTTRKFLEEFGLPTLDGLPGNDQLRGQGVPDQPLSIQLQDSKQSNYSLPSEFPSEESDVKFEMSTMVLDHEEENQLTGQESIEASKAVPVNFDDDEDELEIDELDDDEDDDDDDDLDDVFDDDDTDDDDDDLDEDDLDEDDDWEEDEEFDDDEELDDDEDDDEWEEVDDEEDDDEWEDDDDWDDDDEEEEEDEENEEEWA